MALIEPFEASDHILEIMLFQWAKSFDRFRGKTQLTRTAQIFFVLNFPVTGVCRILLPTRIALFLPCDHLLQKPSWVPGLNLLAVIFFLRKLIKFD